MRTGPLRETPKALLSAMLSTMQCCECGMRLTALQRAKGAWETYTTRANPV